MENRCQIYIIENSAIPLSVEEAKEIFDTLEKDEEERILYSDFIAVCRKQKLGGDGDAGDMASTPSMKNIVGVRKNKLSLRNFVVN